jgi:hypothetical protein
VITRALHWLQDYFSRGRRIDTLIQEKEELRTKLVSLQDKLIYWKARAQDTARAYEALRAQMAQVRVSQSETRRAGWEVMVFIPEEVLEAHQHSDAVEGADGPAFRWLVKRVVTELIVLALTGVVRVHSNGTVRALVFEPLNINGPVRAPRFVQALFEKDNQFKLSEKCWDTRTAEQRTKNAAGCL